MILPVRKQEKTICFSQLEKCSGKLYTIFGIFNSVGNVVGFQNHPCYIKTKPASVVRGLVCAVKCFKYMRKMFFIYMCR